MSDQAISRGPFDRNPAHPTPRRPESTAMAQFELITMEGTRFIKATLKDETIRAEAGALCYYQGNIKMKSPLPSPTRVLKSALSSESSFRPSYTGTGEVYLESSTGGFHVFELDSGSWILEGGTYWASDGSVELSFHRERMITSLYAGEGFIDFQTKVGGRGQVVLTTIGPVDYVELNDGEEIRCEGKYVIARTAEVSYKIRRATDSIIGSWSAGESSLRVYRGPGRVMLCTTPYWHHRIARPAS